MDETAAALALRESEELHRITLLSLSDAVFITDDEGVFTFICPNCDVIFGYGPDEVRRMNTLSALMGRELIDLAQLTAAGEIRNIEHEIDAKDGSRRALLVHVKHVAIRGGTVLYACRDVSERKEHEQVLRRNEQRLTLALEAATAGTWDWDVPTGEMNWSPETHRMFGDVAGTRAPSYSAFLDRVHPLDRERVAQSMTEAMDLGASYETEFRVLGYDQIERWAMAKGRGLRNGKPLRMLGVFVDLTERHQVEQELRDLGGRLISAHEEERKRLSRDLHDDVAQRVTLLAADLELLKQRLRDAAEHTIALLGKLTAHVDEIGSCLHRLSHELHPARLSQLGLEASIRSFCRELAESRQIAVDLEIGQVPKALEADISLCLYRITQEALQNVVKHSSARKASVALGSDSREVELSVADDGVGFDPLAVRQKDTLGLVSMRERVRLVQGRLTLTSAPGRGTRVHVRVPVGQA